MREVGVVSFAQSTGPAKNREDNLADLLLPVVRQALTQAGITRDQVDFFVSGSHDFFEGKTFSYIDSLDAVGAWPPISESHVEMDAAWALHEAYTWLQLGEGEIALVYGFGRGTLAHDLDDILSYQLDPYYLTPLRPHQHALAGIQARLAIEAGLTSERAMAEVVARSLRAGLENPSAVRSGETSVEDLLGAPYVASPLRALDASPVSDAAAAVVLATGETARRLAERPVWIRGIDHRMETHYPGMRDLTGGTSVRAAAEGARAQARAAGVDLRLGLAELHTAYSHQEPLLRAALDLPDDVVVNPSGGPLVARPVTATGLIRIGEAAARVQRGEVDQALAHATHGPVLQHNMVVILEGER